MVVDKLHKTDAILSSDKLNSKRFVTNLYKLKRSYEEALPSKVKWAEKRQKSEASRGLPNQSAELQSKDLEDLSYHEDD